ncbi:hypothetical protein RRSWK_03330 [Rhodopirellula sp. SWK7]|nr:hypothetical protein RRSWK_03330 [Rhodopirellula sp. SWK7]
MPSNLADPPNQCESVSIFVVAAIFCRSHHHSTVEYVQVNVATVEHLRHLPKRSRGSDLRQREVHRRVTVATAE